MSQSAREEIDGVVVVGSGPVGLFTALRLAQAGIPVVVLEEAGEVGHSPRAAGYQWPTPQLLAGAGILADALDVGVIKRANQFRRPATSAIDSLDLAVPDGNGGYTYDLQLGQDTLAEIILRHLTAIPHAEVRWNTRLAALRQVGDRVEMTTDGDAGAGELSAAWVVGADGAHSNVRAELGLAFDGHTWPDRFVASNVYYDFESYGFGRATFLRDPINWAIIIKINHDGLWRIAYGEDPTISEQEVRDRVPERYAAILPGREEFELASVASYRIHERCAERFRDGRVLLAGDAAHICNPAGGFGLMSGLMDANALSTALGEVIAGTAGEEILDRYAEDRRRIFREVVSPRASEYKRTLAEGDPEKMRKDDEVLRRLCSTPEIAGKAATGGNQLVGSFALS